MKLDTQVLVALESAKIEGAHLRLVDQLDRKTYVAVNKVLEALGGDWNRKAKAHIFEEDPTLLLEPVIESGEITPPETFGHFPTPPALAARIVDMADVRNYHDCLEPSAGTGNIARVLGERGQSVDCVELQERNVEKLKALGLNGTIQCADFLAIEPSEKRWSRIAMNPPFAKQQDIIHVLHALRFLSEGGILVSIMSAGVRFRTLGLAARFRAVVAECGEIIDLPPNSFKESGTGVNTCVVVLQPK